MKKVGLFGYGCVAQGFVQALDAAPDLGVEIEKICIRDSSKERNLPRDLFTNDPSIILGNEEIDIIIELIDDSDFALTIAHQALRTGKPIISANKKMVAENLEQILSWQKAYHGNIRYEGAVGGAIPIIENLENFFSTQYISSIRGIVNGSTNYILTQMRNNRSSFEEALAEAQSMGFAESDPSLDISGYDALYKAAILAYHGMNKVLPLDKINREGITDLTKTLERSPDENEKIKLIVEIGYENQELVASVAPKIISQNDPLYFVDYEFNAIEVEGATSEKQVFIGKGAGSLPTGSAVLNDLKIVLNKLDAVELIISQP